MRFLFVEEGQIGSQSIELTSEQIHRLRKVLRLRVGDKLIACEGRSGQAYEVSINELGKKGQLAILSALDKTSEPGYKLHLGLALLKKKKVEFVLQKTTELGVTSFTPLLTQNCVSQELSANEERRMEQTAQEACMQSGRLRLPLLNKVAQLRPFVQEEMRLQRKVFIFHQCPEGEAIKRSDLDLRQANEVTLLVGPEGGFTEEEVKSCAEAGVYVRWLPGHILRAETAAIAVTTLFSLSPSL